MLAGLHCGDVLLVLYCSSQDTGLQLPSLHASSKTIHTLQMNHNPAPGRVAAPAETLYLCVLSLRWAHPSCWLVALCFLAPH